MTNIKLPGGRRLTINTSSQPSGSRKAKTGFISIKGKPGRSKPTPEKK